MPYGRVKYLDGIGDRMNPFLRTYKNRIYKEWAGIHHRCERPRASHYKHYGGRGISVCEEWSEKEGFNNFAEWSLNSGYSSSLEIDRINTDMGYCPSNCRWVTHKENSRNRSRYLNAIRASNANTDDKIIGVIFRPSKTGIGGSWRAMIMADGKNISLGTFKNKEDAIRARLEGERLYWGGDAI